MTVEAWQKYADEGKPQQPEKIYFPISKNQLPKEILLTLKNWGF